MGVDILVWGATGYTGKRVSEYLAANYGPQSATPVTFALGGRNQSKLEKAKAELVQEFPHTKDVQIFVGDSTKQSEVDKCVSQARVVINMAGPYILSGEPIIDACVRLGVHYCDITGESPFVSKMIQKYHEEAKKKGVFIINFCGFDSIPSDIGTLMMVDYAKTKLEGRKVQSVKMLFTSFRGPAKSAGGTARTAIEGFKRGIPSDPYLLSPSNAAKPPVNSDHVVLSKDSDLKLWYCFFFMAPVNTRVVRRSAALQGYGDSFGYNEYFAIRSPLYTLIFGLVTYFILFLLHFSLTQKLVLRILPDSGDGPEKAELKKGTFSAKYVAKTIPKAGEAPITFFGKMKGEHDPGYLETAKMVSESAMCLATQMDQLKKSGKEGGVLTPASGMGTLLLERLRKARMVFEVSQTLQGLP